MYRHTREFVDMLKGPQRRHQKPAKMLSDRKAKQCGAGLETKVVNCCISGPGGSRRVSSMRMSITKVNILQNESEAHNLVNISHINTGSVMCPTLPDSE